MRSTDGAAWHCLARKVAELVSGNAKSVPTITTNEMVVSFLYMG